MRFSSKRGRTVYLHIGCPKSGTSHIQARLSHNVEQAAEQGLLWPVPWNRQVGAVREVRKVRPETPLQRDGLWGSLAAEIGQWEGRTAVISMEWMVGLRKDQIAACVESLAPARIEVICTARDLLRTVPAQWQESMQNFKQWTWQEYVDGLTADADEPPTPAGRQFWRQHDIPRILERWSSAVPADRIHLVTLPPPGQDPDLLWRRFCSVLSVDGTRFEPSGQGNPSLGVVSARLMERINEIALQRDLPREIYTRYFKHLLAKDVLAGAGTAENPIAVSAQTQNELVARAEAMVDELRALKINVVGSLDDLIPRHDSRGRVPTSVDESEMLDVSVAALVSLLEKMAQRDSAGLSQPDPRTLLDDS